MNPTQVARQEDVLRIDRENVDTDLNDFVERQPKLLELLDFCRVATQPLPDAGKRPSKDLTSLQRHQPVCDII